MAPAGKVVRMRFTSFQLEMRQNDTDRECWDYLEVRNGQGPFSPKVTKPGEWDLYHRLARRSVSSVAASCRQTSTPRTPSSG